VYGNGHGMPRESLLLDEVAQRVLALIGAVIVADMQDSHRCPSRKRIPRIHSDARWRNCHLCASAHVCASLVLDRFLTMREGTCGIFAS
jgi:hypothetical protein